MYRARDTTLGRGVAIKVLARIALDRSYTRRAARAGGEDARRAEPVNIAHIYGLARNEGDTSIVMELVEPDARGPDRRGPAPDREALTKDCERRVRPEPYAAG